MTPIQKPESPLAMQVGGNHYRSMAIQPVEYIHANNLGFCEGAVVKYISRWREKGGVKDLEKAKHFIELLMELERKYAAEAEADTQLNQWIERQQVQLQLFPEARS